MYRIVKTRPMFMGLISSFFTGVTDEDIPTNLQAKYANENETGIERLQKMFSVDKYGAASPEVTSIIQGTTMGGVIGLFVGGFLKGSGAIQKFTSENEATKFASAYEASKKLQNKVYIDFMKGAMAWGGKLALFIFLYTGTVTVISVYRGRSSLLEYMIGGAVAGGTFKLWLGLRGVMVGASVGLVMGLIVGALSLIILKLGGCTMEEVRLWQHDWKESRVRGSKESIDAYTQKEEQELREMVEEFNNKPTKVINS